MPTMPPLPDPARDWLPIAVRFIAGAIFTAPFGLVTAMRYSRSDTLHIAGLLAGACIGGVLAAWKGRRFWDAMRDFTWLG